LTLILVSHDIGMVSKSVNRLLCVNVAVTMHDVSNGITKADLHCAYAKGMEFVPHHHK
jgi:ABC-type Mn2+/Zn2+ transport system ATPase subunit